MLRKKHGHLKIWDMISATHQDSIQIPCCQGPMAGLSGKAGGQQPCRVRVCVVREQGGCCTECTGPAKKSQKKWNGAEITLQCPVVIN